MTPTTLDEWTIYLSGLSDDDLVRKGKAINSMDGVNSLLASGLSSEEVEELLAILALFFQKKGLAVPKRYDGQYMELETFLGT